MRRCTNLLSCLPCKALQAILFTFWSWDSHNGKAESQIVFSSQLSPADEQESPQNMCEQDAEFNLKMSFSIDFVSLNMAKVHPSGPGDLFLHFENLFWRKERLWMVRCVQVYWQLITLVSDHLDSSF